MISSGAQADEALRWYKLVLRKHDSDAVRIKIAMLLPSVFTSAEDMKQRWDGVLKDLTKLQQKPRLEADAMVNLNIQLINDNLP